MKPTLTPLLVLLALAILLTACMPEYVPYSAAPEDSFDSAMNDLFYDAHQKAEQQYRLVAGLTVMGVAVIGLTAAALFTIFRKPVRRAKRIVK